MSLPQTIVVEFRRADGTPLKLFDLGMDFLEANGLPMAVWERSFRVEVDARVSKGGSTFYAYEQNGVPLPDGLDTGIRVADQEVTLAPERPSQSGNPSRTGQTEVKIGSSVYLAKAYLSKGKHPYWVKVVAHKKATHTAPRGGRIL
jgi:hypothetical protein